MSRIVITEREGYWLAVVASHNDDPFGSISGEVSEETLQRWSAMKAQWDALQLELSSLSSRWDAEQFKVVD